LKLSQPVVSKQSTTSLVIALKSDKNGDILKGSDGYRHQKQKHRISISLRAGRDNFLMSISMGPSAPVKFRQSYQQIQE
jgi:hypothetical protein